MSDEPTKRRPGRPPSREPRREIHIMVAEDVLAQIDGGYSAFFEAAAREKLEREPAVERKAGRPTKTTTKG